MRETKAYTVTEMNRSNKALVSTDREYRVNATNANEAEEKVRINLDKEIILDANIMKDKPWDKVDF